MTKTLCIDFGNSRCKAALFMNNEIVSEYHLTENIHGELSEIIGKENPGAVILSSVIEHDPKLEDIIKKVPRFHKLNYQSKLPFTTPVGKPSTIGADRLALAAAAVHFFPGKNNLIIGLGSCITYNFINQRNEFLGGSISPGMTMRFRAMHDYTAKLPLVQEDFNFPFLGYDTVTNLQSGVLYGIICELDGMISKYAERYGNFNVVLTGGNSAYFAGELKNRIFADHNFLFKGLYAISEHNNCFT